MKTEIDKYRGWEIYFDTSTEKFTAYSNLHDDEIAKGSYSTIKKGIDDFIKENETFRPIIVVPSPDNAYRGQTKIKIIGIRKDNAFVYEDENGKKHQFSKYDEKSYILYNEKNDVVLAKFNELINESKRIREEANEYLKTNLIVKTVATYRKEMGHDETN